MFGKKCGFIASFGLWQEEGKTKEEAKDNMEKALEWYFTKNEYNSSDNFDTLFSNTSNRIFMLEKTFQGFNITYINKNESKKRCSTIYGRISEKEAIRQFETYVKQYIDGC